MVEEVSKAGFVTVIGRPNVGKSTLINHLVGQKVSITARKPQTTRHRILGIHTYNGVQAIYVDTPGLHTGVKKALNKQLNRTALSSLNDIDVVLFMVEGTKWVSDDHWILDKLVGIKTPVILVINKVDVVSEKNSLMPHIQKLAGRYDFADIVPISAINGDNVKALDKVVAKYLPNGEHFFPDDQITDRSERFFVAEIIREKLIRNLGDEIPHSLAIALDKFEEREDKKIRDIAAVIWVEREGQKKIVIGKDGAVLKKIGTTARKELEDYFEQKVFLQLWVKVKRGWSDDERAIQTLGYKA